jgi:uncharacterized protein
MLALVDANVWLPVLVERHQHHAAATEWWRDRQPATCCWCRPIQQTVLRLLTNRSVMGDDTLQPAAAWLVEPIGLAAAWRENIATRTATPKLWMDAFLAAWAHSSNLAFVTFDAGFKSYQLDNLQLLSPQ